MTRSAACRFSLPYHPWGINLSPTASISLSTAAKNQLVWGIIVPVAWVRLSAHPRPKKDTPIFVGDKGNNPKPNRPARKRKVVKPVVGGVKKKRGKHASSEEEEGDEETS